MAYNQEYPYISAERYNADWLLSEMKRVTEEWTQVEQDWKTQQDAFESLKTYVINYFNNLNITEEVNNKINSMIADGTFTNLLTPIFNDIFAEVTELQQNTIKTNESESVSWNMLTQEVRNKMVSGSIPKINDSDIVTPYIADGAVTPIKTSFITMSKNLFNIYGAIIGSYMNINGVISNNKETLFSGFIPIKKDTTYYIQNDQSFFGSALFCALYNTDKSFDKTVDCTLVSTFLMSYTAEHNGYIRVNATLPYMYGWYVGLEPINPYRYIPYENYLEIPASLYKKDSVTIESTNFIHHVGSVVEPNIGGTTGFYINSDLTLAENSEAAYSNVFLLQPGTYVVRHPNYWWGSNTYAFIVNGATYQKISDLVPISMNYIVGNTTWCRFTLNAPTYLVMNYLLSEGLIINTDNDFSMLESYYQLDSSIKVNDKLYGKSISIIGDSIAEANGSGGGGYASLLARKGMEVNKLAVGGATIMPNIKSSDGSYRWCITENILNIVSADYIFIEGGVNDSSLRLKIGSPSFSFMPPFYTDTFYGALDQLFYNAYSKFISKKIGFLIVHKMDNQYSSPNGTYYQAVVYACKKWGIPYLDLSSSAPPLYYMNPSIRNQYTVNGDGWHPNLLGYETFYISKIVSFLESL